MDQSLRIANQYAQTTYLHPLIALLLLALALVTLFRGRNAAMAALLVAINFITAAQRISISGLDLPIYRIMICIALLRIVLCREQVWFRLNNLDLLIIFQVGYTFVAGMIRNPAVSELGYAISVALDNLGGYLVVRMLVRDRNDMRSAVTALMWISFLIAALFVFERMTGRNPMAAFGGVAESTWVRGGKMRVQGPYPQVILAGAVWAAIIPLFIAARLKNGIRRPLMYVAVAAAAVIIVLCASSTPLVSLVIGIGASVLYYQRDLLGKLKAAIVIGLILLALFWNKPIWYLVAKVDLTGGSTGYFRYFLIDSFISHWKEWILIGTRTTAFWGLGLADVANRYVSVGVDGGLPAFAFFIASIVFSFRYVGLLVTHATGPDERRDYWALGVSVLVHLFNFIGVSYFSQVTLCWWISVAFCASLYQSARTGWVTTDAPPPVVVKAPLFAAP
jgi:hypothetical protein